MIISLNTYYIFCGIVVAACILPYLYGRYILKQGDKFGWSWIPLVLLIPINWYTPAVYDVKGCDDYTKEILIFPTGDYSLGRHNYIINNGDTPLLLEYIVYGNVSDEDINEDEYIIPGQTLEAPFVHLNYVFEEAPESIKLKGKGAVHSRLSCSYSNLEEALPDRSIDVRQSIKETIEIEAEDSKD